MTPTFHDALKETLKKLFSTVSVPRRSGNLMGSSPLSSIPSACDRTCHRVVDQHAYGIGAESSQCVERVAAPRHSVNAGAKMVPE